MITINEYQNPDILNFSKIKLMTMQGSKIEIIKTLQRNYLNKNILICGTSGTGKSTLLRIIEKQHPPVLKILFKPDQEKALSISEHRIYIENDRVNFCDAWKTSQETNSMGYMLIQEQLYIESLKKENQKIEVLKRSIKAQEKTCTALDKPVLQMIEHRLNHLYPYNTTHERITGTISMDGLTEDEYIYFSDYILRSEYEQILNEIISIDEIHRLKPLLDTTISRLTREIRSRGGLIATSQSLSDLPPELINNFGTIYLFGTIDRRDLEYLSLIDPELMKDVLQLNDHEFIELRSYLKQKKLGQKYKMEVVP